MDIIKHPQYRMNRRSLLGLGLKALGISAAVAVVGTKVLAEKAEPVRAFATKLIIAIQGNMMIGSINPDGEFEGREWNWGPEFKTSAPVECAGEYCELCDTVHARTYPMKTT